MSLVFRNVRKISKCKRSRSRTKYSLPANYFHANNTFFDSVISDDFPPLKCHQNLDRSPISPSRRIRSNRTESTESTSPSRHLKKEQGWTEPKRKHLSTYSECLVKTKIQCEKSKAIFCTVPETHPSIFSIRSTHDLSKVRNTISKECISTSFSESRSKNNIFYPSFSKPETVNKSVPENVKLEDTKLVPESIRQQSLAHIISAGNDNTVESVLNCLKIQNNEGHKFVKDKENMKEASKQNEANVNTSNSRQADNVKKSENSTFINVEIKPIKKRSIHTIKSANLLYQPQHDETSTQASLFPNKSWFLRENLSDQFGFSQTLNSVQPIFKEGNVYAACYEFPAIPQDLYQAIKPYRNPILKPKKDFRKMFCPYRKPQK